VIDTILNFLFRCSHKRFSRPTTPVNKKGVPNGDTYVVCLECGKEFVYDLTDMRIGKPIPKSPTPDFLDAVAPKPKKKLRLFAILAAAAPIAWIVGRTLKDSSKKSRKTSGPSEGL
jgi:hypothetical protein